MTIETDTRCTICGRCSLWCTCVGTFAIPCVATPSPCERDAQDGRGEGAEGLRFVTHVAPIKTKLEQDNV